MNTTSGTWSRLHDVWMNTQTSVTLPFTLIPVGILAILLGDRVSKAFTNIGGGTIIRIMGVLLLVGSVLAIASVVNNNALYEVLGLALVSLGTAIYSAGVVIGLGLGGVVAGIGYGAITLTLLGRIYLILKAARVQDALNHIS